MESPVRIKSGFAVLLAFCLFIEISTGYPSPTSSEKLTEDDVSTEESSTLTTKPNIRINDNTFKNYARNNTWRLSRKNNLNVTAYITPIPSVVNKSTTKNNVPTSTDSTTSPGSKITFRGTVRYFATRPPFTPKKHILKKSFNQTVEASEHSSVTITPGKYKETETLRSKVETATVANLPIYQKRKFTPDRKTLTTTEATKIITEEKASSKKPILEYRGTNRSDSSKALDLNFNIDKYTSDEFHDVNNVYSQSISPEIEHFIIPENVSDYFVSVGSRPISQSQNNYIAGSSPLTTPKSALFDKKFKEVSESIKQNLADSEYADGESFTTELVNSDLSAKINFDDILSQPLNNNSKLVYKNTKELSHKDSQDPRSTHKDFVKSNGTNIYYESSMVSTENYDYKSSTHRIYTENNDNEISSTPTPLSSNKIERISLLDNKITKNDPNIYRRVDHLRSNLTRKEFLTTIRMRAHTTPRPRTWISLKNRTTTLPTTTKAPEIVKMIPFVRKTTLTTVSSKIDPVYQDNSSPSKLVGHTMSQLDNSIPTLRKRGSFKSSEEVLNSTSNDDKSTPFIIPPTATAWALITLKDTRMALDQNTSSTAPALTLTDSGNTETIIKTEDELQKLDKSTESNAIPSENPPLQTRPTMTTSKISFKSNNFTQQAVEENKLNTVQVTSPSNNDFVTLRQNSNHTANKTVIDKFLDNLDKNPSFESITKFPSTITTPAYEADTADYTSEEYTSEEDEYYQGTTGEDSEGNAPTVRSKLEITTEILKTSDESTLGRINFTPTASDIDLTTFISKPYSRKRPTLSAKLEESTVTETTTELLTTTYFNPFSLLDKDTTSSTIPKISTGNVENDSSVISTAETLTTSEISNLRTTTYNIDKMTDTTTQEPFRPMTQSPSYSTSTIFDDLITTKSPDISTTILAEAITNLNTDSKITTDLSDDLSDFSFGITSSSPDFSTHLSSKLMTETTSMAADVTTTDIKNTSQDIEAASTMYYSSTFSNSDYSTPTTVQHTSPLIEAPEKPTVKYIPLSEITTNITPDDNSDSREAKTSTLDEDERITNIPDQGESIDDWIDSSDPPADNSENPTVHKTIQPESENSDNDVPEFSTSMAEMPTLRTSTVKNNLDMTTMSNTHQHNIEVIEPSRGAVESSQEQTVPPLTDDSDKYDDSVDSSGAIAAITISAIGVVALLLLVGLLIVARGRRRSGGYGQRCTPVSLDSYSLDNVSISGSTRRKPRRVSKRSYGNPAYDESGATSHPMQFAALANFALDQESIMSEFNEIPTVTVRADEVPPGCETKNRYSNVIPLPETRVYLTPVAGDDTSEYINANYVRGPKNMKNYYIACQAPLSSTVNDFWRMIWEQNSRVILMLTEFMENGAEKCFEYLPPSEISDSKRIFGNYQVTVKKREVRDKYVISSLQVKCLSLRIWRDITHMWYFWPARGVPEECHSVIAFLIEARSYLKASQNAKDYDEDGQDSLLTQNGSMMTHQTHISMEPEETSEDGEVNIYNIQRGEQKVKNGGVTNGTLGNNESDRRRGGPLVVHCSPGTGRTGAVIACDIGIRDFEMSRTVDIPKTVYRIRRDRANAVQTKDQYIFVYKVLSEYATKLTGGVLDSI